MVQFYFYNYLHFFKHVKLSVFYYKKRTFDDVRFFGTPSGTRTLDPLIKSQLLYQLSYEVFLVARAFNRFAGANMQQYFLIRDTVIKSHVLCQLS